MPALLVPDNTEIAVIKACLYDSQINRSYPAHSGTAIPPGRPRRPRDRTKVGRHNYPNLKELAGAIGCQDLGRVAVKKERDTESLPPSLRG